MNRYEFPTWLQVEARSLPEARALIARFERQSAHVKVIVDYDDPHNPDTGLPIDESEAS